LAKGEGVKIDLDSSPFIQVQGMAYTAAGAEAGIQPIFYIADGKSRQSFLQSANYDLSDEQDARGLHIDLNKGYIHAKKNFKLETVGFEVETTPTKIRFLLTDPDITDGDNKLFFVSYDVNSSGGSYYLQSRYFNEIKNNGQSTSDPTNVKGGVKLDLHNGTFEAVGRFSFKADNFELNAHPTGGKPYFAIYDDCNPKHTLFYAAEKSYYLKSCRFDDIKNGNTVDDIDGGVKLDLSKGLFEAIGGFSFKADNFELNAHPASGKPYFAIYDDCKSKHKLFYAAEKSYYLQSCSFDEIKRGNTVDGIDSGVKLDLSKGLFEAIGGFSFKADNFELNANPANDTKPYFAIYDSCESKHTLFYAGKKQFYLQSCGFDQSKLTADKEASGLQIQFATETNKKSSLKAYGDFELQAKGSKGEIRISTNAKSDGNDKDYPFSITGAGDSNMTTRQFHVDWQGKLFATGGTIGGWGFYNQTANDKPTKDELVSLLDVNQNRWNVLFATTKRGQSDQKWHVFGANQDNVIAIGIPHDKVFLDHNFNQTDGKGAAFTVMYDGTMHARKGTIAGWYLTSSYI
jgi:hypothetical protein